MLASRENQSRQQPGMMRRITENDDEALHEVLCSRPSASPELYGNARPSAAIRIRRSNSGFNLTQSLTRLTSTASARPTKSLADKFKAVAMGGSTSSLGALLCKDGAREALLELDWAGWNALHTAAKVGRLKVLRAFIQAVPAIDDRTTRGRTPLHYAAQNGHLDVMECLLDAGANVMPVDCDGMMPIHLACSGKDTLDTDACIGVLEMFLKRGVHVDVRSAGEQMTPLQYVAARGDTEIGLFLIEHGAATDLGGEDGTLGRSLVDIAGTNGNLDFVNMVENRDKIVRGRADAKAAADAKATADIAAIAAAAAAADLAAAKKTAAATKDKTGKKVKKKGKKAAGAKLDDTAHLSEPGGRHTRPKAIAFGKTTAKKPKTMKKGA